MKEFFDGVSLGLLPADRLHTRPLHALRGVGTEALVVELEVGRGVEVDVAVHGYVSFGVDEPADVGLHDDGGGEGIPRAAEDAADLGGGVGEGGDGDEATVLADEAGGLFYSDAALGEDDGPMVSLWTAHGQEAGRQRRRR